MRYWRGIPAGLVAIAVGYRHRLGLARAFGMPIGGMSADNVAQAFANFGFSLPLPAVDHVFAGFEFLGFILVTAIPFGIYDLVEAMDNVESAAAAGDSYPTTRVLTADGVVSLIGCLMGNPFINAVYIGHPGWKAMGGRIGYSAATGLMVIVLAWFGIIALVSSLIPVVAISPILLYIGMLIGAQAFQETPEPCARRGAGADAAPRRVGQAHDRQRAGRGRDQRRAVGLDKLAQVGVLYQGLAIMGGGAILGGLVLGAIAAFVIDGALRKAAAFALAGAVLTFFGFMHGEAIGIAQSPLVALSYLAVAGILLRVRARRAGHAARRARRAATPRTASAD